MYSIAPDSIFLIRPVSSLEISVEPEFSLFIEI